MYSVIILFTVASACIITSFAIDVSFGDARSVTIVGVRYGSLPAATAAPAGPHLRNRPALTLPVSVYSFLPLAIMCLIKGD